MSRVVLIGGKIVSDRGIRSASVFIDGGKITGVTSASEPDDFSGYDIISTDGCYIVPGYIDLLAHGALGFDFYSGPVPEVTKYFAAHGTTSVLAGLRSAPLENVFRAMDQFGSQLEDYAAGGSQVLGAHLESIYYNPEWCGAQNADQMRLPNADEVMELVRSAKGTLKMVSIAPELPGAISAISSLVEAGVKVSIGHTDASPDEMDAAIWAGASTVTHLFNATGGPFYKEEGVRALDVSTFALTRDALIVQVIADGIHVDPDLFMLTYKAKGARGIALTTDASSMAGFPDGHYEGTFGRKFVLKDGACRLSDGRLAASRLTLDEAVKNVVSWGVPLADAIEMSSYVPAKTLGLAGRKGRIVTGYDADIALLNENLEVKRTMIAGETVHLT